MLKTCGDLHENGWLLHWNHQTTFDSEEANYSIDKHAMMNTNNRFQVATATAAVDEERPRAKFFVPDADTPDASFQAATDPQRYRSSVLNVSYVPTSFDMMNIDLDDNNNTRFRFCPRSKIAARYCTKTACLTLLALSAVILIIVAIAISIVHSKEMFGMKMNQTESNYRDDLTDWTVESTMPVEVNGATTLDHTTSAPTNLLVTTKTPFAFTTIGSVSNTSSLEAIQSQPTWMENNLKQAENVEITDVDALGGLGSESALANEHFNHPFKGPMQNDSTKNGEPEYLDESIDKTMEMAASTTELPIFVKNLFTEKPAKEEKHAEPSIDNSDFFKSNTNHAEVTVQRLSKPVGPAYPVRIVVYSAHVPNTDHLLYGRDSDTYCSLFLDDKWIGNTPVIMNSNEPKWMYTFPNNYALSESTRIALRLYDDDYTKQDFIGEVRILFGDVVKWGAFDKPVKYYFDHGYMFVEFQRVSL